jgi:F420-dependent oxidoreductase-like protein
MKLALGLEVYNKATLDIPMDAIETAEHSGYHSVWTAEAYGSDALTTLAYLAGKTTRIKLGTAIVQVAARTPASTAMSAMTIDALAGGNRTIIGLGVSGPQIVEGWYGQPWGSPHHWLRDYVSIMRKIFAREEPVTHTGKQLSLPFIGDGSVHEGKALKSIIHPVGNIQIWIASGAPLNTALAAEVADGWLPMGYGLDGWKIHGTNLESGFRKRQTTAVPRENFQLFTNLSVEITDDIKGAIDRRKPQTAMYVGGMGSEKNNYHRDSMARRGFPEAAQKIQDCWLSGDKEGAVQAVPDEYIDQNGLIGSSQRIRERFSSLVPNGATGLMIRTTDTTTIELMAEITESEYGLE